MRSYFHRGGWWLTGLAVATFVGVHVVKGQAPARPWYDAALFSGIFVGLVVAIVTTDTVWKALVLRMRALRDFLPTVNAPKQRLRFRKRYDVEHARALVSAGRMGERLSGTFDVGEPDITPKSVAYPLRSKQSGSSDLASAATAQPSNPWAADLHARLLPYLQQGLEMVRKQAQGVDSKLLDRAAEKWTDEVRALLEPAHPEVAFYFTIPTFTMGARCEGQSRRVRQLTQRLSWFLSRLRLEIEQDEPSPHHQATELLAECNRLISETWEGQAELSTEPGTGDVGSVNALFRKARPILAKHYPDEMHRLDYDVPEGASAEQVGKALSNALPAFHNFQKKCHS